MSECKYDKLKYNLKITIYNEEKYFGPGVAKILTLVKEAGTLSAAYKNMNMSSSKAWKIIRKSEEDLGIKLISTRSGGSSGGKSVLTEEAEDLLIRYELFVNELEKVSKKVFHKHFNCDTIVND